LDDEEEEAKEEHTPNHAAKLTNFIRKLFF
jgi:hypothetical protein